MADLSGFISNNGGGSQQMGQGLAYVLPESRTGQYAMQLAQEHTAQLRADALFRQKQQQQLEAQYQDDLNKQKLPEYWAAAGKPINDNYNQWLKKAADYHATTGRNPFNNPEYQKEFNDKVLLPARQSKELEQGIGKLLPLVAADNEGHYTEESKNTVNQYVDGVMKNPLDYLGKPLPQLAGTPSGIQDLFKLIKPVSVQHDDGTTSISVPDVSKMKEQAYALSHDPRWNNLKASKYGINNDLPDFAVYNQEGKRVWYTNPKFTSDKADAILANPNDPVNAEVIAKLGITDEDPYKKEKLQTFIAKQNQGMGTFISDVGRYGNSIEGIKKNVTPDRWREHYDYALAHPKKTTTTDDGGADPVDLNIPYGTPSPTGAQPNVNVKGFIPISIPSKNLAGIAAYNLTDGTKNEVLAPSDNYSIVGIGNYPFIKKGAMKDASLDESIAQPDFIKNHPDKVEYKPMLHIKSKLSPDEGGGDADHLIPDNRLPANIKNNKAVKQALQNFKPAGSTPAATKTNTGEVQYKGKTYKMDAVQKAATASGMSVKEYLKAIGG
jgi:hypothetical protein